MVGLPTVQVQLDDANNGGTWPNDITAYFRLPEGFAITRGRSDELSQVQPGSLTITLDNTDGRFTLGSTAGGYGAINVDRGIRVKVGVDVETNYCTNPSLESGTMAGWTAPVNASGAVSSAQAKFGTKSLALTSAANGDYGYWYNDVAAPNQLITASPGEVWTGGLWVRMPRAGNVQLYVYGFDSTAATTNGYVSAYVAVAANTWTWVSGTTPALAAGTTTVGIAPLFIGGTLGEVSYVDGVVLEKASGITTQGFDGSFAPSGNDVYVWTGTANASASVRRTFTSRFTGFVQAWPVSWPSGSDQFALVQVTALDAMARWARRELRSVPEEEILLDKPIAYYTMGDPAQASPTLNTVMAVDSSGNNAPSLLLTYITQDAANPNPVFGSATGPGTDGLTAAQFPPSTGKSLLSSAYLTAPTWAECAFLVSTTPGVRAPLIWVGLFALPLEVNATGFITTQGITGPFVADGQTHVAATVIDTAAGLQRLYLDGVQVGTTAWASTVDNQVVQVAPFIIGGLTRTISHIAVGSGTPPSAARFAAHATALSTGFSSERTDQRASRLASYEGSASGTSLDTGQTNVPFLEITGKNIADAVQQVADAEQGVAYIDGQGRTTFHNRTRSPLKATPDLTLSVNSDIVSEDMSVQADTQQVINYATGTREGDSSSLTQVAADATSQKVHGRYSQSYSFLVKTDDEVYGRIAWLVSTHKEPVARIPSLTLDLIAASSSDQASTMALDIDSRVRVTNVPSQSPTGTTADLSVQGWTETLTLDAWTWSANTSSWAAYEQAWILQDATYGVLGSTTRLAI